MIDEQTLEIIEPTIEGMVYPERTRDFGIVNNRLDGTFVIQYNGMPYHVIESDPLFAEVEAYLKGHPEALISEPVPPAPTQEELDAREIQTLTSYLASTDWIIAKIGEVQMKGGDITALVGKYSNELQARGDARERINELEEA